MIRRGDRRRRVEDLEAKKMPSSPGDNEAMSIIWQVLEEYPRCKTNLLKIKGIRQMSDEEAMPLMLDILDDNPEAKAAIVIKLQQERKKG